MQVPLIIPPLATLLLVLTLFYLYTIITEGRGERAVKELHSQNESVQTRT